MIDWQFLRQYENWTEAERKYGGGRYEGTLVRCELKRAMDPRALRESWPTPLPRALEEFWDTFEGGTLFLDVEYGQWGLDLLSPAETARETVHFHKTQAWRIELSDVVIGKFRGDTDLLIVDHEGRTGVSLPLDPRSDWYWAGDLVEFLKLYVAHDGDKHCER